MLNNYPQLVESLQGSPANSQPLTQSTTNSLEQIQNSYHTSYNTSYIPQQPDIPSDLTTPLHHRPQLSSTTAQPIAPSLLTQLSQRNSLNTAAPTSITGQHHHGDETTNLTSIPSSTIPIAPQPQLPTPVSSFPRNPHFSDNPLQFSHQLNVQSPPLSAAASISQPSDNVFSSSPLPSQFTHPDSFNSLPSQSQSTLASQTTQPLQQHDANTASQSIHPLQLSPTQTQHLSIASYPPPTQQTSLIPYHQSPSPPLDPQSSQTPSQIPSLQPPLYTNRTNIHYIHPINSQFNPAIAHNPHSNVPPHLLPPPPQQQTITARAVQYTIQSLDEEMITFLYTNFKNIFEMFELYDFDANFLLEFSLCIKALFFIHFEFQNKSSYLNALQNVLLGRKIRSTLLDRFYITPILGALKVIFFKLYSILQNSTRILFGDSARLFSALLKPFFTIIISKISAHISTSHFLTKVVSIFRTSFAHVRFIILKLLLNPFTHSPLSSSIHPPRPQLHPATYQHFPQFSSISTPQPMQAAFYKDSKWQNYSSPEKIKKLPFNTINEFRPGLTITQRILLFSGSIIFPYVLKSFERKMRNEDWQWRDEPTTTATTTTTSTNSVPDPIQTTSLPSLPQSNNSLSTPPSHTIIPPTQSLPKSAQQSTLSFFFNNLFHKFNHFSNFSTLCSSLFSHLSTTFFKISTKWITLHAKVVNFLHRIATKLYSTQHYHKRLFEHFLQFHLLFKIITFLNTILFITNGQYITPLHRIINITQLSIDPSLPLPPPIFDSLHQGIATGLIQDILVWISNIMLSLTNSSNIFWLMFPMFLPISFFLRSTVQQAISTQEQLQQQYNTTSSRYHHQQHHSDESTSSPSRHTIPSTPHHPITLFTHCKLIYRRLLGYDENTPLWDDNSNNNNHRLPKTPKSDHIDYETDNDDDESPLHPTHLSPAVSSISKQHHTALQQRYLQFYSSTSLSSPAIILKCTLCKHTPTLPCRLFSCSHVYCWYCVQQLYNANQVCVDCLKPILGFQTWGKPINWESAEHFVNRTIAQAGGNINDFATKLANPVPHRKLHHNNNHPSLSDDQIDQIDGDEDGTKNDLEHDLDLEPDQVQRELEALLIQQHQSEQNHEIRRLTTTPKPHPQIIPRQKQKKSTSKRK